MSLFANAAGIMTEIVPVLFRGQSGMAAEVSYIQDAGTLKVTELAEGGRAHG